MKCLENNGMEKYYSDEKIDQLLDVKPKNNDEFLRAIAEIDIQMAACDAKSKRLTREIKREYPEYLSH